MKTPITSSMLAKAIVPVRSSRHRSVWRAVFAFAFQLKTRSALIAVGVACFALPQLAQAQCPQFCDTNGAGNTALGVFAFTFNTTGYFNTAVGSYALYENTTGYSNTAIGLSAMQGAGVDITGNNNTATGVGALLSETSGSLNVADGSNALFSNGTGSSNVANGSYAMYTNTTGSFNTANGANALYNNVSGISNTANGAFALQNNTTGFNNTANGVNALFDNTTGSENAANGTSALSLNTTGLHNTAEGSQALLRNTTGNNNIALGFQAGQNLTTGSSNIHIGNAGVAGDSRKIRIGTTSLQKNTYIAGIYGVTVSRGIGVIIDPDGHLGTTTSSARFKEKIQPMDKASEAIHSLQPVTFRYKHELDPQGIPQFGLVAEDVEKVNPDLVARDEQGKPYTVRYEAVNAMLLNEFLKEHRKVEEQQATIAQLKSTVAQQQKRFEAKLAKQEEQIETLTAGLQKVSAQLEASKPAPQVVNNP